MRTTIRYKNWKGKTRTREVIPVQIRIGSTKWHPKKQWLLTAIDPEDGQTKDFALQDCNFAVKKKKIQTRKNWIARVRDVYTSPEELEGYDTIHNIARRCGFKSARSLWRANPLIGGSVNPEDFGRVSVDEENLFTKRGPIRHRLKTKKV